MPVQIRLSNCLHIADSLCTAGGFSRTILTFYLCFFYFVLAKRQRAAPNLSALCRFKFAFQTVCVSPTACVRRAAFAAPFRQCADSNSPFKPLVHIYTSSDGRRLSPHPSGSVPVQIRLSNRLCVFAPRLTASGYAAPS